jgi:putative colanic acid biosynthesis acetyltransferase WcaF
MGAHEQADDHATELPSQDAMPKLDIGANRYKRKWSRSELCGRALWALAQPLFQFSPRPCWAWRRWLLRRFGARIGRNVHIHPSVRIFIPWNLEAGDWSAIGFDALIYNLGVVRIGERVTVSQRAHLCAGTHDFRDPTMPLKKVPITIGNDAWICADAFVGPDVTVGEGAVVGARTVVVKDVSPWTIVAGNPAREIGRRTLADSDGVRLDG